MARARKSSGSVSVNLSGLNVRSAESAEFEGAFVKIALDEKGEDVLLLPLASTVVGFDEDGVWYADSSARVEALENVGTINVDPNGNFMCNGADEHFVYIPKTLAGRLTVNGAPEIVEETADADTSDDNEPEQEETTSERGRRRSEPEQAPAPASRRRAR
jgi:hypothetical protein